MDLKHIGLRIKYHRRYAGLTQKQLADKIGTTWEMVSRYETGKSSPLRRLTQISEALNVSASSLLSEDMLGEEGSSYRRNTVPLLDKPFSTLADALKKTRNYYAAPDWVVHTCMRPFAINLEILTIKTAKITGTGIVYISQDKPESSKDIVLVHDGTNAILSPHGMHSSKEKVLGTAVAYEQRLSPSR